MRIISPKHQLPKGLNPKPFAEGLNRLNPNFLQAETHQKPFAEACEAVRGDRVGSTPARPGARHQILSPKALNPIPAVKKTYLFRVPYHGFYI